MIKGEYDHTHIHLFLMFVLWLSDMALFCK